MSGRDHGYRLMAPWYVRSRGQFSLRDERALRPEIQKYATSDLVQLLLEDPRESLQYGPEDCWSYPMPVKVADLVNRKGRQRFATHELVRTGLRKLYQANHDRFYAVVVELFCDLPGLPRANDTTDLEVCFVLRKQRTGVDGAPAAVRKLARELARELFRAQADAGRPGALRHSDVEDVLWSDLALRRQFEDEHAPLLEALDVTFGIEAWTTKAGVGSWQPVEDGAERLAEDEQTYPMWRLPPREEDCAAARTRSLWFGLVPTFTGDLDAAGNPKLDDRCIYQLRCFARRRPQPGRVKCPPRLWWSAPTTPFRLASFYDPEGTRNRKFQIQMPDFRALEARAAQPAGPGGVEVVSPPGSQMDFPQDGGIPPAGSGKVGGDVARSCTFAIELLMIVAFFLFSLFLPIVVFVFQLWWLLALRFCLPISVNLVGLLEAHFSGGKTLADLPARDRTKPSRADREGMDELLGQQGVTDALADATTKKPDDTTEPAFADKPELVEELVTAIDPSKAAEPTPPEPEDKPDDPLCT